MNNNYKILLRFLKENNCYKEYMNNINNDNTSFVLKRNQNVKEFLLNTEPSRFISFAFNWNDLNTIKPKNDIWVKIARLWTSFILNNNID